MGGPRRARAILTHQPRPTTHHLPPPPTEPPEVICEPPVDEKKRSRPLAPTRNTTPTTTPTLRRSPLQPLQPPHPFHLAVSPSHPDPNPRSSPPLSSGGSPADFLVSFLLGALCIGGLEAWIMDVTGIAEMVVGFAVSFTRCRGFPKSIRCRWVRMLLALRSSIGIGFGLAMGAFGILDVLLHPEE
ncbi:hypothetical protein BJ742DRAFT_772743 [Cladochytrium replicatum]|nr:hypothetical protein BJ742DRAFT_772743 [Cladochytrium replicatum]